MIKICYRSKLYYCIGVCCAVTSAPALPPDLKETSGNRRGGGGDFAGNTIKTHTFIILLSIYIISNVIFQRYPKRSRISLELIIGKSIPVGSKGKKGQFFSLVTVCYWYISASLRILSGFLSMLVIQVLCSERGLYL
jgi:hypothetical protein